jgi:hypothetical protein
MEVAAAKATLLPREGRARQKERKAASQTVRIGDLNRSSTLWKKLGWDDCQWVILTGGGMKNNKEQTYKTTIAAKSEHHAAVGSHREESTMPDADNDQSEECKCSIRSKDINKDLQYWLSIRRSKRIIKILNRKQETQQDEESKQRREPNRADNTDWCTP